MSGGSYDYACYKVGDFADSLERNAQGNPLRIAFVAHVRLVAKAMHDIEWVDSGDYGTGDDEAAIRAVLHPADEVNAAIGIAEEAERNLRRAIERAYETTGGNDD
jgi:hypothetical protein